MPVAGFLHEENLIYSNLWRELSKNVLVVTIAREETECADRIIYKTGIYKADRVSARARKCFFYILMGKDCPA